MGRGGFSSGGKGEDVLKGRVGRGGSVDGGDELGGLRKSERVEVSDLSLNIDVQGII